MNAVTAQHKSGAKSFRLFSPSLCLSAFPSFMTFFFSCFYLLVLLSSKPCVVCPVRLCCGGVVCFCFVLFGRVNCWGLQRRTGLAAEREERERSHTGKVKVKVKGRQGQMFI